MAGAGAFAALFTTRPKPVAAAPADTPVAMDSTLLYDGATPRYNSSTSHFDPIYAMQLRGVQQWWDDGVNLYGSGDGDLDLRYGSSGTPRVAQGPGVKISQTENITNLATQMGGNKVNNEENAAFYVADRCLDGSLGQVNAILATAKGAPSGTDVIAVQGLAQTTGGNGIATGAYFAATNNSSGSRVLGAEIRASNERGTDITPNSAGISDGGGLWVTTASSAGKTNGVGVAVGQTDASQWVQGFQVTQYSVKDASFVDNAGSVASFRSAGAHTTGVDLASGTFSGAAVALPPTGTTPSQGISFDGTTKFYRDAAGSVKLTGKLNVNGAGAGWAAATGTAARTTFVTSSVTLPELAKRVKALIDDLTSAGLLQP